jgi:hypothetical protein
MLKNFVVLYDDDEYPVSRALDAQDAAQMACQRIWDDKAGEAFDTCGGFARLAVRDETGAITTWNVYVDMTPSFWARRVEQPAEQADGR